MLDDGTSHANICAVRCKVIYVERATVVSYLQSRNRLFWSGAGGGSEDFRKAKINSFLFFPRRKNNSLKVSFVIILCYFSLLDFGYFFHTCHSKLQRPWVRCAHFWGWFVHEMQICDLQFERRRKCESIKSNWRKFAVLTSPTPARVMFVEVMLQRIPTTTDSYHHVISKNLQIQNSDIIQLGSDDVILVRLRSGWDSTET